MPDPIVKILVREENIQKLEEYLKKDNSGINEKDYLGYTPLMWAVTNENEEIVRVLLKYGADVSIQNKTKETAYEMASRELKLILDPNRPLKPPQILTALSSLYPISSEVASPPPPLIPHHATLRSAIKDNNYSLLDVMLQQDKRSINDQKDDYYGYTPLMSAIVFERIDCIKVLLAHGADQSIKDNV